MLFANSFKVSFSTLLAISLFVACTTGIGEPGSAGPPDIGDPNPDGRPPGEGCANDGECRTGVCADGSCQAATSTDGVRNGDETDIDCGGSAGPPCGPGKSCAANPNCASGLCVAFECSGGPACGTLPDLPLCADGMTCGVGADCASGVCDGHICKAGGPKDGVKNGDETDIDCGGPHPNKCGPDQGCLSGADCQSKVCTDEKRCAATSYVDGVKNGDETDIDCGGPNAPNRCAAGRGCNEHADCESNGCAYDKRCAIGATCTQLEGGQTCGPNEGLGKQKDCCEHATVGAFAIDKYLITAGRMRAFLERHDGKIRDWAATLPAGKWNQAWTAMLPNSIDGTPGDGNNANTQLGPFWNKRSCETGYHTGHTFWTPAAYGDTKDFPKNVLDTKALNCVPWWLMQALCVFDGGRLLTEAELRAAYTNSGTTAYPWGARGTYTSGTQNPYSVQLWGYSTPNPPPDARTDANGYLDIAFNIAPPGRRPTGYNNAGIADLVGNLLEWVGDSERQFVWKGSFENHAREADMIEAPIDDDPYMSMRTVAIPWRWQDVVAPAGDSENVNGYYGIGGRCGY